MIPAGQQAGGRSRVCSDARSAIRPRLFALDYSPSIIRPQLFLGGCAAAASTDEIDGRTKFEQRVLRWRDAVETGNGIEDDGLLLVGVIRDGLGESDRAQIEHGSVFGPVDGRIVDDVS